MLALSTRAETRHIMLAEIMAYLESLEDYERWKDFFESSTGKTMLDLLTGISELLLYKLEVRSLDSYLPTAISPSAAYLLSQMVGYNPNRKSHAIGTVRIKFRVPPSVQLTINAGFTFDSEIPLVVADNVTVPVGTSEIDLPVIQGEWVIKEWSRALDNLEGRAWEALLIEEEDFQVDQGLIYVEVDNSLLDLVHRIELVSESSAIVRTDYKGGALLLFGDGVFGYLLRPSSVVRARYLRTLGRVGYIAANTDLGPYTLGTAVFDAATLTAVQGGTNEDSIEKVKYLASRFFQTQGRAVTAYDYEAILMSFPGVISAKAVRTLDQCCTINVSALKDTVLSTSPTYPVEWSSLEIEALLDYLEDYKMLSSRVVFVQPVAVPLDISIEIVVPPLFDATGIEAGVIEYLKSTYCFKLGGRFLPTRVVDNITDAFPQIKRSYMHSVNGADNYPDIALAYNEFFSPGAVVVSRRLEITDD